MPDKAALKKNLKPLSPNRTSTFRSNLMSMMYFAVCTRWDVIHPLVRLAQNMQPTEGMWEQLTRVAVFLGTNAERGVMATVRETSDFAFYVDSDHAGDRVINTRSHTGILIFYNGAPVAWQSRKHTTT